MMKAGGVEAAHGAGADEKYMHGLIPRWPLCEPFRLCDEPFREGGGVSYRRVWLGAMAVEE